MVTTFFKSAWRYRSFIVSSIRNDFKMRFNRSKLGGLWMVLHPLALVLMYALVLSAVLSAKLPGIESRYACAIFLTAGMLSWSLFSEVVTRCLTIFIENGSLMQKVVFPKICLPLIVTGTALFNNIAGGPTSILKIVSRSSDEEQKANLDGVEAMHRYNYLSVTIRKGTEHFLLKRVIQILRSILWLFNMEK